MMKTNKSVILYEEKEFYMNKINQLNGKKLRNVLASSVVLGTLALTGCSERELATEVESIYDVFDVNEGVKQVIDVPGEEFKLVVEYSADLNDESEWTITAPKKLTTKTYTQGLDGDTNIIFIRMFLLFRIILL